MSNMISNRQRAALVGVLIIAAYAMLTYTITNHKIMGVVSDLIAGFAVIAIPLLMLPIFKSDENKTLNFSYMTARFIEGLLMLIGAIFILSPSLEAYRNTLYEHVQVYFFIAGALLFYILLYRTKVVPRFISVWGGLATLALFAVTILGLFGVKSQMLDVLVAPMILNELFLAIWLMVKGFDMEAVGGV